MSGPPRNVGVLKGRGVLVWINALDRLDATLMGMAMRVVATWSYIDAIRMEMVASFIRGEYEVVTAMFAKIDNEGARQAAYSAAAEHALVNDPDGQRLFEQVTTKLRENASTRNQYAHSLYAHAPAIPDALVLIDPREIAKLNATGHQFDADIQRWIAQHEEWLATGSRGTMPPIPSSYHFIVPVHQSNIFKANRIQNDIARSERLHRITYLLADALRVRRPSALARRELSDLLSNRPEDQEGSSRATE